MAEKLRASESFLERTGKMAGVGGWELDMPSGDIHWSAETCRIHDVPVGLQAQPRNRAEFLCARDPGCGADGDGQGDRRW